MNKLAHIVNSLDSIATEIEEDDSRIALAIDILSDTIEKKAFNQSSWLPGRSVRTYPNMDFKEVKCSTVYICLSCNLRRYKTAHKNCPRCGKPLFRIS